MSKYIGTDKLKQMVEHEMDMQDTYLPAHFFDIVDDMPAADVAEVVRCKECKHRYGYKCDYDDRPVGRGDYCSRGERVDEVSE